MARVARNRAEGRRKPNQVVDLEITKSREFSDYLPLAFRLVKNYDIIALYFYNFTYVKSIKLCSAILFISYSALAF